MALLHEMLNNSLDSLGVNIAENLLNLRNCRMLSLSNRLINSCHYLLKEVLLINRIWLIFRGDRFHAVVRPWIVDFGLEGLNRFLLPSPLGQD